jgi:ribosome biogenesis GTPase / thiamine phosphate phosphatase
MIINNLSELGWNNHFQSQLSLEALESELPFRVTAVQRNLIECVGLDALGQQQQLQRSTYPWRNSDLEAHPTVGDWLMVDQNLEPLYLLERKTVIKRRSAGRESLIQLIAANIDTLFIVTSCNDEFNLNRIERYLALAAETHIDVVVALTKSDLCEDTTIYVTALRQNNPDLPIETVNATDPQTLSVLEPWCYLGQTVALLGSSGVGKSTITNGLLGSGEQATSAIREADSKGRHTTTSRSLHRLSQGGIILDTPGMRELQMVDSEAGVHSVFADIEAYANECYFQDCQHHQEPNCAVQKAIEQGRLELRRLDNYHKLMSEQARNSESVAERRHNDRALGRFYKHAIKSSRRFKSQE